jgi:hypothetical protein
MELNFAEDRATGRGDIFEDSRLSRPDTLEASAGSRLEEWVSWLRQRQSESRSPQKVLQGEAVKRFPASDNPHVE